MFSYGYSTLIYVSGEPEAHYELETRGRNKQVALVQLETSDFGVPEVATALTRLDWLERRSRLTRCNFGQGAEIFNYCAVVAVQPIKRLKNPVPVRQVMH